MIPRRPNGPRLSWGALKKKVSFNILRAASFKRLLGGTPRGNQRSVKMTQPWSVDQGQEPVKPQ